MIMNGKLVIAVSGPPGAGTSSVAKDLASRLNLKYFSPGLYFKSHSKKREESKSALDVWRSDIGRSRAFHRKIDGMQTRKAKAGGVVVCGKLSIHVLDGLADFKVWLESPLADRAARSAQRDGISKAESLRLLEHRERMERKEWKRIYGIDYFDQKAAADIVADVSGKGLKKTVDAILAAMYRKGTKVGFLKPLEKNIARTVRKKGLTVTVSGLSKTGKSTIAKSISRALNLRYVSAGEIQRQLARENGISLEKQVRTRKAGVDYTMDRRSLEFAMRGGVLIDARLSGWVAGDWSDARIFVKCSLTDRAERLAKDERISVKAAKESIRKRDSDDSRRYKQIYGIDQTDESIYDIVLDNSRMTLREAKTVPVKFVKELLKVKGLL